MFPKTFLNCNTINWRKFNCVLSVNANLIFLKIQKCNNSIKINDIKVKK